MAETASAAQEKFRIGRVFGQTFGVIGRNLLLYVALTLLIYGLPLAFYGLLVQPILPNAVDLSNGQVSQTWIFASSGISSVLFFVCGAVLSAALTRAAVEDLNGHRPRIGNCLRTGFTHLLPVLGITIIVLIGSLLGSLALIVPGIVLYLGWVAAIPVQVQERFGVFASLSRSRGLAKGSKWRLFWLYLIFMIVLFLVSMVIGLAVGLAVGMTAGFNPDLLTMLLSWLPQLVSSAIFATIPAVCYVELRAIKEGTSVEQLAEIFA